MSQWKLLRESLRHLADRCGLSVPSTWDSIPDVELGRRFVSALNAFLYQTHDGIEATHFRDEELQRVSDFHRFWEEHHADLLAARTDAGQAALAAEALHKTIQTHGRELLGLPELGGGLTKQAIAQVRFFSTPHVFRSRCAPCFDRYRVDPEQFSAEVIAADPEAFVTFMGLQAQSQTDKRAMYARKCAEFLLEHECDAYGLASRFGNDAAALRDALMTYTGMGYGLKKANMFIRDMYEAGVWPTLAGLDRIDVASDRYTMAVALRTRVLTTRMPLVSSLLDIFCHQYRALEAATAPAWRSVWAIWREDHPDTCPASPCLMDSLLYRIGRDYCKAFLFPYRCANGHAFYHFGGGKKRCAVCHEPVERGTPVFPCQVERGQLPRQADGSLLLNDSNLLFALDGVCLFEDVCKPKHNEFSSVAVPKVRSR